MGFQGPFIFLIIGLSLGIDYASGNFYYDESYSYEDYSSYEDYGESYEDDEEESYEMEDESTGPSQAGRAFSWWGTVGTIPAANPYGSLKELYWGIPRPQQIQQTQQTQQTYYK